MKVNFYWSWSILLFQFLIPINYYGQQTYLERTLEINSTLDTLLTFKTVNLFPSFVEYRLYDKTKAQYDLIDHGFSSQSANIDTNYTSFVKNQKFLKEYFDFKISKKFNHFLRTTRPIVSSSDSLAISKELKKVKELLKDSLVANYKMSDTLYSILKKYPADNEILVDILFYQNKHFYPKSTNHWALLKFFVFDLRNRDLLFYNYKIETGGWRYDMFSQNDVPYLTINQLIRGYKRFCKQNKRYAGK